MLIRQLINLIVARKKELITNGSFSQGNTGWTTGMSGTWTFSGGVATLTASADHQVIQQTFDVIPNCKYCLSAGLVPTNCQVGLVWYNGVTYLGIENWQSQGSNVYVVPPSANRVSVRLRNYGVTSGSYTFDNISFIEA